LATRILPIVPDHDSHDEPFAAERHAYTHGGCGLFALGLQRVTGWPMVSYDIRQDLFAHMGVLAPDGAVWDARGRHETLETFIRPFGDMVPKDRLRVVTFEELCAYAPGARLWPFMNAERHASMMYPELPHLPTSDRSRTVAFMDDVETASRRHDTWIIAQRDAMHCWPVIGDEFEEIVGYRVAHNRGVTTFDRALRSEAGRGPSHAPQRIERFMEKLTAISRRHMLWIRAGLPTTWPRIDQLDGADVRSAHYVMRQTDNGGGFLVNAAP